MAQEEKKYYPEVRQGTLLTKDSFCALICSVDDIKGKAEENGIILTDAQIQNAFEFLQRKMSDMLMDDFWMAVNIAINEVRQDE